jgi:hypothetical protein
MIRLLSSLGTLGILLQVFSPLAGLGLQDRRTVGGSITLGPNVQVSKQRAEQRHFEVLIASDPENPRHLLACSMLEEKLSHVEFSGTIAYMSFDGGMNWQETLHVAEEGKRLADPACAYGPGGTAYMAVLAGTGRKSNDRVLVFKSTDMGKTWEKPAELPFIDREYLTIDNISQRYRGRVYLNGRGSVASLNPSDRYVSSFALLRSVDSGKTFVGFGKAIAFRADYTIEGMGNGVVLSDGTFVAITGVRTNPSSYTNEDTPKPTGRIVAISSKGSAESLLPLVVSDLYHGYGRKWSCAPIPVLAADNTSGRFKDRLYVAWSDFRSGRMAVVISHSSDKGKTWSVPVSVDTIEDGDETVEREQFLPAVAVNSSGVLGVMWYDRRDSPDGLGYWPRFSASLDGGESYLPSVKISAAPTSFDRSHHLVLASPESLSGDNGRVRLRIGVDGGQFCGGDTNGLSASEDGVFQSLWIDNRTGVSQVWTAPIVVSPAAIGSNLDASSQVNVTNKIRLHFGPVIYDHLKPSVALDASLENSSIERLQGPFRMRVLSINSRFGQIAITNSDNEMNGIGAVWDFPERVRNEVLKPATRSLPKRLEFRLTEMPKSTRPTQDLMRIVEVEVEVLNLARVTSQPVKATSAN